MIAVVDSGVGNIEALLTVFRRLNIEAKRVLRPEGLFSADKIILPGVGTFDFTLSKINDSGMRGALDELVVGAKVPLLGICVGMQILANSSEEGEMHGLGWIGGRVRRLDASCTNVRMELPHIGWNTVVSSGNPLFKGCEESEFYFLHSYHFEPDSDGSVLARTDYGFPFASAVWNENVFGVQFHPEKSHDTGLRLLKNFAAL